MARFKVRLRIQNFELDVEGNREDAPLIAHAVTQQFAGMLSPAAEIIDGDFVDNGQTTLPLATEEPKPKVRKRNARKAAGQNNSNAATQAVAAVAIDWSHNPAKWGSPKQSWTCAEKAIWLLWVVTHESGTKQMSGKTIVETFNKHFRQSGLINTSQTNRDLGRQKGKTPATVGEDTTKNPPEWFLTDAGNALAADLAKAARGEAVKQPS